MNIDLVSEMLLNYCEGVAVVAVVTMVISSSRSEGELHRLQTHCERVNLLEAECLSPTSALSVYLYLTLITTSVTITLFFICSSVSLSHTHTLSLSLSLSVAGSVKQRWNFSAVQHQA